MTPSIDADDVIVFTDLDGTLLDHDSYDYAPALPGVQRLNRLNVPLILASSKTAAEMVALRDELKLTNWPMICENGAGIVPAGGAAATDAGAYDKLRVALDRAPDDLRTQFTGFGDMGPERIGQVTGLPPSAARLAAQRQFSEPGLWSGSQSDLEAFLAALKPFGISARRGGRFLTLSFGATKADQMARISRQLGRKTVIALGDAPNDAEMLAAADYAIVLPNAQGHPVPISRSGARPVVIDAARPGPEGWQEALSGLLNRLGLAE